jgi:hypothetical protein
VEEGGYHAVVDVVPAVPVAVVVVEVVGSSPAVINIVRAVAAIKLRKEK